MQGSVLGPLLFLAYINDLDTNIVCKMFKFADDTKLWHRVRNPDDIMELQEDQTSGKWVYLDKFSVMHNGHNNTQSNYNMSNKQLPTSWRQQRDLGIIIAKDLKW